MTDAARTSPPSATSTPTAVPHSSRRRVAAAIRSRLVAAGVAPCLLLGACDGGEAGADAGAPCVPYDYATFDGASPGATLAVDVMPIFQESCSSATCHGSKVKPQKDVYLGPPKAPPTPDELELVRLTTIDVDSAMAVGMKIVAPGRPEASFLMHKLDHDFLCTDVVCAATNEGCGTAMPQVDNGVLLLPLEQRDTVRRWIAQGAPP